MFLRKINDTYFKWHTQGSITNRLTFLYTFVTIGILLLIAIAAYCLVDEVIITAEKQYIIDEVQIIRDLLKKHPHQLNILEAEVNAVPIALKDAAYHYYVRIYDYENKTLLQTPGMQEAIPNPKFPALDLKNWRHHWMHWQSPQGKHLISMTAPIQVDAELNKALYMQMVLDGTYPETLLTQYSHGVIIFFLSSIFIVILLGRLITKNGLRRLYDMIRTVEKISPELLTERLEIEAWPRELVPLGKSFNKMLERIETAFQKLSECTTELAHELRTPINNLMLATEVTLGRQRSPAEYETILMSNFEEYQKLSSIIDSVLFLSNTENPQFRLTKEKIHIDELLNKIVEFYKITATERNIKLILEGKAIASVDSVLLQRAVSNLLANAIQHTSNNGNIKILLENIHEGEAHISIQDNGNGIPEKQLKYVFNKFYRVNPQASEVKNGVGLGLAIVKSIIELHNGKLFLKSKLGVGTTVDLYFPFH